MSSERRKGVPARLCAAAVFLGLVGGIACQPAAPAPTTAPAKPTDAAKPTTAPAAASPVASPVSSPVASPVAVASPSPSPSPSPAAARVVTFDGADFAFNNLPDTLPAGRVTLVMRNTGQEPHHAQLARLNTGVTIDQFMTALRQGEGPALALVALAGGPGPVGPGASSEVTLDLREGTYVALCFIASPDGLPHLAKGMVKPFQVTAPPMPAAPQPTTRETLIMKDFTYELPASLPAGRNTFRVNNTGPSQPHELTVARLQPGATVQSAVQYWTGESPSGPPPYITLGGMQGIVVNEGGWMTVDLTPGEYAALCVIPDPTSGKRHIELGMITPFTVR